MGLEADSTSWYEVKEVGMAKVEMRESKKGKGEKRPTSSENDIYMSGMTCPARFRQRLPSYLPLFSVLPPLTAPESYATIPSPILSLKKHLRLSVSISSTHPPSLVSVVERT